MEGDIHRIRVLEAISILRCDAGMSMRAIEEAKIVKERSMRLWVAGKKENQKIRVQHIEALNMRCKHGAWCLGVGITSRCRTRCGKQRALGDRNRSYTAFETRRPTCARGR